MKNFNGLFVLPSVYKGHPEGNNDCIVDEKALKVKGRECFVSKYQFYFPTEDELRGMFLSYA